MQAGASLATKTNFDVLRFDALYCFVCHKNSAVCCRFFFFYNRGPSEPVSFDLMPPEICRETSVAELVIPLFTGN